MQIFKYVTHYELGEKRLREGSEVISLVLVVLIGWLLSIHTHTHTHTNTTEHITNNIILKPMETAMAAASVTASASASPPSLPRWNDGGHKFKLPKYSKLWGCGFVSAVLCDFTQLQWQRAKNNINTIMHTHTHSYFILPSIYYRLRERGATIYIYAYFIFQLIFAWIIFN